ncbi:glycosyltransferase family 4 protein [Paraconexibacter sp.]|uniref:glycosyltransferase family 4 protein n=1 Tax=Paraconexibacter sp. TaxID=2949640 RepID=UPI0035644533
MTGVPRLLGVNAVDHPGGAEVGLLRLAQRLTARGWEITLTSPEAGPLARSGYDWARLDVGGLGAGEGARAVASWPRARRLARMHDIVYLNSTVCGRLLPALRGHRAVLHVHDVVDRVPRHWHRADLVLADSQAVADRLEGLDPKVVYCPVELDPEQRPAPWPAAGPEGQTGPVIGYVGRIEPRKGVADLVAAAPAIHAGAPGSRVVLIGDDPYDADPGYLAQVRESTTVEHLPWVPDAQSVMRHMSVLVAPSHQEPFGTVLSEAMAVGVPVVATRVGGLGEVVEDGVTGVLVEPGDPQAIASAVLRVLDQRDRLGGRAREAARRFGADAYSDRVEALLRPLLSGNLDAASGA